MARLIVEDEHDLVNRYAYHYSHNYGPWSVYHHTKGHSISFNRNGKWIHDSDSSEHSTVTGTGESELEDHLKKIHKSPLWSK